MRLDPQRPQLTKTGDARKALQTFHWPKGTAARDKGKREISAGAVREDVTGCEQDDRISDPRFCSASTDRKHRSNARTFLLHRRSLPHPALASPVGRCFVLVRIQRQILDLAASEFAPPEPTRAIG